MNKTYIKTTDGKIFEVIDEVTSVDIKEQVRRLTEERDFYNTALDKKIANLQSMVQVIKEDTGIQIVEASELILPTESSVV